MGFEDFVLTLPKEPSEGEMVKIFCHHHCFPKKFGSPNFCPDFMNTALQSKRQSSWEGLNYAQPIEGVDQGLANSIAQAGIVDAVATANEQSSSQTNFFQKIPEHNV